MIERTPATATPQSWWAELAELNIYGTDSAAGVSADSNSASKVGSVHAALAPTQFSPQVEDLGQTLAISTPWYRLVLDKRQPRIVSLALDSLGKGELGVNLLQASGAYPVLDQPFEKTMPLGTGALTRTGNVFRYAPAEVVPGAFEQVVIRADAKGFDLSLAAAAQHTIMVRGGLFRFELAETRRRQRSCAIHRN